MTQIPLTQITVLPHRQRTSIDDESLTSLTNSISTVGLMHPLVVRKEGAKTILVAGERRLRALENLSLLGQRVRVAGTLCAPGYTIVTDIGTLDPLSAFEAELEENIRRVDLSWQDRTAAEAQLVELRELQAGEKGLPKPTLLEVGKELFPTVTEDVQRDLTRQAVVLQRNMHIPEIAKAPTQRDAWKILKRHEQDKRDEALATSIGTTAQSDRHSVHNEDCRSWLRHATEEYDCILIDPPYGMGADTFGDAGGKLASIEHRYADEAGLAMQLMREVAPLLYQRGRAQSHLYVWCDIDRFSDLKSIFADAGYWVHRTPLVNIKREGGRVPWPEHGPRRCYEIVLYGVKGKRPVTAIYRDVFESTLERDTDGHGAAKPVEAYVDLLKRSCRPGDTVLDCFAGTGTILAAAEQLKLRATAVEKDPTYYGQCLRRLETLK